MNERPLNVAVFASGGGSNFQSLLDHHGTQDRWRVRVLIMNREGGAEARAAAAGVPVRMVPTRDRDDAEIARDTLAVLDEYEIDVALLAGYLRRVPQEVIDRFAGRMLNIHPALLPEFGGKGMYGMHVHRAVVESEAEVTGATVHFVTAEYDDGAILGQWQVSRLPGDSAEDVARRVLQVEHRLYPAAVDHLAGALIAGRSPARMAQIRLDEPPDGPRTLSSSTTEGESR